MKSIAEQVVDFAYSLSEDGTYRRPRDGELRDFGGRLISSSNDGASLVSCGQDGLIRLWKVRSFAPDGPCEGHGASVNTLSFSADGGLLASGSSDGTVRVWSFPGGRDLDLLDGQVAAAVSPAAGLATISTKARAVLWDDNRDEVATLPLLDRRLFSLAFTADGASLLVAGAGAVHRVDAFGVAVSVGTGGSVCGMSRL